MSCWSCRYSNSTILWDGKEIFLLLWVSLLILSCLVLSGCVWFPLGMSMVDVSWFLLVVLVPVWYGGRCTTEWYGLYHAMETAQRVCHMMLMWYMSTALRYKSTWYSAPSTTAKSWIAPRGNCHVKLHVSINLTPQKGVIMQVAVETAKCYVHYIIIHKPPGGNLPCAAPHGA